MALINCRECGKPISTEAAACPQCGAPQRKSSVPLHIPRERIESIMVAVGPDCENQKIEEMACFGWNLKSSQEVIGHLRQADSPDTLGAAVLRGAWEGATGTKTLTFDHRVKLQFTRDTLISNWEEIRELEQEYLSLSYPDFPRLFPGGFFLVFFWYPFWPLWYFYGYKPRKAVAEAELAEVLKQREEILARLSTLLQ